MLLASALLALATPSARADETTRDYATLAPELGFTALTHAVVGSGLVLLATDLIVSNSVDSVTPLGGYNGISPGALVLLTSVTSMALPVISGSVLYLLERNDRQWRIQPGLIFAAGVVPEIAVQTYYAAVLRGYTLEGGLGAPNLWPKLLGAQIAGAILVPIAQVVITHLFREPDPER